MIINPYSVKQHAFFSAFVLIIGISIGYIVLIMPAVLIREQFEQKINDLEFKYSRLHNVLVQKDEITRQLYQLKQQKTDASGFLKENSPALAAAELQEYIKNVVESNYGILTSTQAIDNKIDSTFPQVTIKVHIRCDIESLQRTIHKIETGLPLLLIDNVYIQSLNSGVARSVRSGTALHPLTQSLDVRFDVIGFIYQAQSA